MASQAEEECTCPVCCDIFNDPVLLLCGHSFCKHCLQEWWRKSSLKTCPVCKELFPMPQPPRNLALRNLSDALREKRSQTATTGSNDLCLLHGEKHKLFCHDDQLAICVICRDAKAHKKHNCVPINEAAEDHRAKLKIKLLNLKSKLGSFEREKLNCDKMASHILFQTQQTEKTIKAEFQKLYQFLRAEETARIDACRKEATQKSEAMSIRILNLTAEILALKDKIKDTKEDMRAEDISFLLNIRTTKERSTCKLPQAVTPSGALMDEAKHVGNLRFSVLKKMANIVQYTPVILDPNTSSNNLMVSENLTCSTKSEKSQPFPCNPERLNQYGVLGYEGFTSGKHSWDVQVDGYWAVGVAAKSKDHSYGNIWGIYMCVCTNILRELTPEDYVKEVTEDLIPQKVRVQLDYDQGILSFFDLGRKRRLHSIKYTFKKTVFPYFRENAKLLPATLSVNTKQPRDTISCVKFK
ncbi:zinc-binding protein A33-like isoform 1-T2 [Odontesthes bonariensis]|uniref:zinc-binding protein A33-like n=1 Tax=Odontesthes bonariensis TaxID=219752 RepID=UPI003F5877E7